MRKGLSELFGLAELKAATATCCVVATPYTVLLLCQRVVLLPGRESEPDWRSADGVSGQGCGRRRVPGPRAARAAHRRHRYGMRMRVHAFV